MLPEHNLVRGQYRTTQRTFKRVDGANSTQAVAADKDRVRLESDRFYRSSYVPDRSHSAEACSSFVCCFS